MPFPPSKSSPAHKVFLLLLAKLKHQLPCVPPPTALALARLPPLPLDPRARVAPAQSRHMALSHLPNSPHLTPQLGTPQEGARYESAQARTGHMLGKYVSYRNFG